MIRLIPIVCVHSKDRRGLRKNQDRCTKKTKAPLEELTFAGQ